MVFEGLRGEDSIAELCHREGIIQNLYYRWSRNFATSDEVKDLRHGGQRVEGGRDRADARKSPAQEKA